MWLLERDPVLAPEEEGARNVSIIEPRRTGTTHRAREVWRSRYLLRFFGHRALQKLYARTKLGRLWIVLRPLLDTGSRALIFGGLLGAQSNGTPYFLFFLAGMAVWTLFDRGLFWATRSLELNRNLVRKLYFPRLLLPLAGTVPALVEFVLYGILAALTFTGFWLVDGTLYLQGEVLRILGVILALLMTFSFALAIGLWTSVLGATTRDMRFTLNYVLTFWFFITPVIYPLSQIPERFQALALANPMTPIVELFKWGLMDAGAVKPGGLAYVGVLTVVVAAGGLWFFTRAESHSVDRM